MTAQPPAPGEQDPTLDRAGDAGDNTTDGAPTAEFADGGGSTKFSGVWEAYRSARAEEKAAQRAEENKPWYPSLEEPLQVDVYRATVSFDGRRLVIERGEYHDSPGSEAVPVHQIASVTIRWVKRDDQNDQYPRLVFELNSGRTTFVEFEHRSRQQVEHLKEEVSRAISHQPLTGRRPPVPKPSRAGLIMFLILVVLLIAMLLD